MNAASASLEPGIPQEYLVIVGPSESRIIEPRISQEYLVIVTQNCWDSVLTGPIPKKS